MKFLHFGLTNVKGRSKGRISSYNRGGGHKRRFRYVDNQRFLKDVPGKVIKVVHDPYRTAKLAMVGYTNGIIAYNLLPEGVGVGSIIKTHSSGSPSVLSMEMLGHSCELGMVKAGTLVHNVENKSEHGGQIARSAGSCAVVVKNYVDSVLLKLPSGSLSLFSSKNLCTIGAVGFSEHKLRNLKKAGASRWRGRRPHVRGTAMNPIDHPQGGRTNGGKFPRTPWGRLAKGVKTRKNKKW